MSHQPDDLLPKEPAPKTIPYQPPTFNLTRPTTCLTMNERIQVHHNYISAISSLEHKKDLINRLKQNDTHNIVAYEAEMTHHMTLHEDVLERLLTILKQDDYYRTLEDLPVIDGLTAYDDIKLFPELYDTVTIIERVTSEADLIERQLRQAGMYPLHTTPLPSSSMFIPRPTPTFQPIIPASQQPVNSQHTNKQQNIESSPESSLPCGQRTPTHSDSITNTQSQNTPPQPVVPSHPQEHTPMQTQNTSPPTTQNKQPSPIRTDINPSTSPPFQLQRHSPCPVHHNKMCPNRQMVKE